MSDITKCNNETCTNKLRCYRYTAIPNEHYQAYATFEQEEESGRCEYYWPNKSPRIRKRKKKNKNKVT